MKTKYIIKYTDKQEIGISIDSKKSIVVIGGKTKAYVHMLAVAMYLFEKNKDFKYLSPDIRAKNKISYAIKYDETVKYTDIKKQVLHMFKNQKCVVYSGLKSLKRIMR